MTTRISSRQASRSTTPHSPVKPLAMLIALAFAGTAAHGQAVAPADAASAAEAGKLQTVTVTAERITEDVKTVPISVSTIGGEALDVLNSGGEDVRALSGRVPSLNIESSFGRAFPRFYIRGYGNTDFHLNASQPVSLIYDDVVQENPILKGFPMFDVNQVEVLAGPQGTLFGRNTPAGVVKFDSVAPSRIANGYFNASYGSFNTVNLEGAYGMPLGPDWAIRGSMLSEHRNGFVTNTAPGAGPGKLEGYDDEAGRLQLLYKPSGTFSALFNVHARALDGTARLFRANIIKPGTNDLVDGFDPYQISIDGKNSQTVDTDGASAKLRWDIGGNNILSSITGWEHVHAASRGDVDGGYGAAYDLPMGPGVIPFADETSDSMNGHEQLSQEFRVEHGGTGPLTWQTGLYLYHEKYKISSFSYDTLFHGPTTEVDATQHNTAWAVFGSVGYALTDKFKLRGGLRYTRDRKYLDTIPVSDTAVNDSAGLSKSTSDSRTNWDLSGTYAVTPDANVYARVATGFRASSIFPASDFGYLTYAKPETTTSYETGVKADLFDRRARVSADVFHYEVKDQQLSAVGGESNATQLINAKKVQGQGFEINLDAYVLPTLLVTLNGSYNFTKIKDPGLTVAPCATCTVTNPKDAAGNVLINGNPLPQAPKYVANVTARYGIPTASGGEYFVYTDWSYRSKVNFFLYESKEFTGKAMTIGGLRAGYDWDGGKYEVAAFARNITNQIRVTGGIDFNNLTGFINDPRTVGVQFKATF
ncbi:TonB-dependent receptor [Scleromatobacter humisilvae]|uniref:TonB-dependent receptor n=1 Tax=Scleromatobacter humisilvae TaxID=2897159 RepID=A0A9X2BZE2_9BURK|nr:TonB-dependent receptor [Scleromatobacter humisilvae]MCK9686237.1 TonB-dependent receptor [Scleromatobacter humisilvae]